MSMQFEIYDDESGAFSYAGEHYHPISVALVELLEDDLAGRISEKQYLAGLERLRAQAPEWLDAHYYIAARLHDLGKPKKALEAALLGLEVANRHIPEGFSGLIEWGHLENRPYLRLMHIALLAYMNLRRHKDALALIELMLARNPSDNQGIRYLLGPTALRAGDYDRARTVLEAECDSYPPNCYDLAMCNILSGDRVAAATALRRGFAANAYIAELLGGCSSPIRLAIWHDSNFAEPEIAEEYIQTSGDLWGGRTHDAIAFTRWLFNHPKVLLERAAIMECKEALLWETDPAKRQQLVERERTLNAGIDNVLSESIVTKRMDRRGKMVWPWASE